jgi:iron complex outermembrane receptor protein
MTYHRATSTALGLVLVLAAASPALAQEAPTQTGAATPSATVPGDATADPTTQNAANAATGDDVVVTGTRAPGRTRLDSASPVDVLSATSLRQQGTTELGAALAQVAPSIDFPRAAATDATDAIRPATLRGLSPDETLVLVNGVRKNTSASLNINGTVGRGAAAVDLNTIPTIALDRVEVLREGASAQYGSDAIAGVVNLRLRESRSGGSASVQYGFYNTDVDTARGDRRVTGEPTTTVQATQGFGFGSDGFVTVSGEYVNRKPTNRADFDPRVVPTRITGQYGDPSVNQYTGVVNAGVSIAPDWKIYGWASYQDRDTRSAAFPRLPKGVTSGYNVDALYPAGFIPQINSKSRDLSSTIGIKGNLAGWSVDLNATYGVNKVAFRTLNSANFSLGNASQTSFSDGAVKYDQWVGNLDVTRQFDVFKSLNVAFGLEGRREGYKIEAGEPNSYTGGGAQGYAGFAPDNRIERSRRNGSIYLDLEAQVTDKLLVGLAGRGEDYSDFGSTGTGKATVRYDFAPWFALRGGVSTGFRAPALQQEYFTSISPNIQNGTTILTGTFPSVSETAKVLGGLPLEPEKSINFSAGTVIRVGGFDLTIDGYLIKLRDQLGLSENLMGPAVTALLAPTGTGATAARFFINGLASTTKGIDAVGHYRARTAGAGTFDFTVAANINQIRVTRVPTTTSTLNPAPTLFARSRIISLQDGTPGQKVTATVDWSLERLGALARVTYYGGVTQPGTTLPADIYTGDHAVTDLELHYNATKGAQFALGVSNLFDVYPDATPGTTLQNSTGVIGFPYYSPFGFNGRFLYVRAGLAW